MLMMQSLALQTVAQWLAKNKFVAKMKDQRPNVFYVEQLKNIKTITTRNQNRQTKYHRV